MRRLRFTLHGRVQDVNLRSQTAAYARGRGIAGWIRNDASGSVTLEAEAESEVLGGLIDWLTGPHPLAKVTKLEQIELTPTGDTGFHIVRWWHNFA